MSNTKWKGLVGKQLTPDEFDVYVNNLKLGSWTPKGVTIHHTASPNLEMRPKGFTAQHLLNLQEYYRDEMGWSAGPHLFIDQTHINIFSPLTDTGVHAVSFNKSHWGVEMLGDYDSEKPDPKVIYNTYRAVSALLKKINRSESSVNFHRDDPTTNKTCPGKLIDKKWFIPGLANIMDGELTDNIRVTIEINGVTQHFGSYILAGKSITTSNLHDLLKSIHLPTVDVVDHVVGVASFYKQYGYSVAWNSADKKVVVTKE